LRTRISLAEVTGDNIAKLNRIPAWNDRASECHCRADFPKAIPLILTTDEERDIWTRADGGHILLS
jgi:hypothetical protein